MQTRVDLRKLAEREGAERSYVSLYLSGSEGLESLSPKIANVQSLLADEPTEREHFDKSMAMIQEFVEESPPAGPLCIFASWAEGYLEAFPLERPLDDLLWIDSSPYIRPLAELQDEFENFAVVAADDERTRIFYVTAASLQEEHSLSSGESRSGKRERWAEKRYERRRGKELRRYAKDVVACLKKLAREKPFRRLVMIGSGETLGAVRSVLPPSLENRLVAMEATSVQDDAAVWDEAYATYVEEERAEEEELWGQIKRAYMRGSRAAVGAEDVLAAAREGRMAHLLVDREADIPGTRCRNCETLHPGELGQCPNCEREDVFPVDLINELVELAEKSSTPVEFSDPIKGLSNVGHVAALLRY